MRIAPCSRPVIPNQAEHGEGLAVARTLLLQLKASTPVARSFAISAAQDDNNLKARSSLTICLYDAGSVAHSVTKTKAQLRSLSPRASRFCVFPGPVSSSISPAKPAAPVSPTTI